ncbi:PREDICTED: protein CHUP1, chloroplastic [Tarenaya hassleriana]|uniref:protein CHUP1, chloroplastic n=1 Tax=Tarenaya hassleriana TaxID=28532 RepID=UPI00053CA814|nr:PREDICTED: protein CHUP1, chloroplastic [Tarenaya hassleriana]
MTSRFSVASRGSSRSSAISGGGAEDENSACNGGPKARRRSVLLQRPSSGDVKTRSGTRPAMAEQFGRPWRPVQRKNLADLEEKLVAKESLIKDLEAQVVSLKAELQEARSSNAEMETKNQKLSLDLASAESKILSLSSHHNHKSAVEHRNPRFKDIQRLIASKLEESVLHSNPIRARSSSPSPSPPPFPKSLVPQTRNSDEKDVISSSMAASPPPPPPPPPPRPPAKAARAQKSPPVAQLFHLLNKQDASRELSSSASPSSVHSSIVGEIQNRSAHLLAIKSDIETKGDFINHLIRKVLAASFSDMEHVLKFVDWLDEELSSLADERAVLKHFKWPEKKADALREAAVEYRDLRKLENELSSYSDDPSIPYGTALKKMVSLLDKSEQSTQRLVRLRSSAIRSYQEFRIPSEWMLDSGIVSKIKRASIKLAKTYMKRVAMEMDSGRESAQEALVLQGVRFAYRTYQFAGGLDSEALCALEEIKKRVPIHSPAASAGDVGRSSVVAK